MLVSEHKCTINVRDSLIIAKFNDLFFFEFSVDGNIEQIVLNQKQVKNLIRDLEGVTK